MYHFVGPRSRCWLVWSLVPGHFARSRPLGSRGRDIARARAGARRFRCPQPTHLRSEPACAGAGVRRIAVSRVAGPQRGTVRRTPVPMAAAAKRVPYFFLRPLDERSSARYLPRRDTGTVSARATPLTAEQRERSRPRSHGGTISKVSWGRAETTARSTERGGSNPGPRPPPGRGAPDET